MQAQTPAPTPDFAPVSKLITDAIAAHQLPGAVVLIGHNGKVVFEHAYGDRKLAGEPGLDGKPSPAEPMTEDTIFDMASLTKDLATATAIMQLYEAGKIASFDDPVEKYLPAFNAQHDEARAKVTLRMLLTHTSGEAPDVDLKDAWGLAKPDRAEGIRRALTTPLKDKPGAIFTYSDINFILLGYLVEQLSGQPEDVYVREHIFVPLDMTETRYLPPEKACGPHRDIGAAIAWAPAPPGRIGMACPAADWSTSLLARIAPTTHDDESKADPVANPHFDMLTRGTVHDPTTRRMGGVAGHAGVFSTAHDVSLFASALLEKLTKDTGPFPLKQSTLQMMTRPEEPTSSGAPHLDSEMWASMALSAANAAEQEAIKAGEKPAAPGLAPAYPAIKGQNLRGFGWDIDTGFSKPRGMVFAIGSFGHTGFTGTSLWMDPASDTYVILLANAIHPRGGAPISNLRGQVATAAAKVLRIDVLNELKVEYKEHLEKGDLPTVFVRDTASGQGVCDSANCDPILTASQPSALPFKTLSGIDVLEQTHFTALGNYHHMGLLTNQSGLDAHGTRTIDVLTTNHQPLTALFTPEHGLSARQDTTDQIAERDQATNLPVISLYGAHDADRRPTHAQLAGLDAVVIDLQDAGVHFWTYEAAMGYFLEAASTEQTEYHHTLTIVVLDRPNPIGGLAVQGPVSDRGRESYVNYMPLPVRHGLTLGELAGYIVATKRLATNLVVVRMEHWQRSEFYADTGLPWVNPSPNLRSPDAALRYPALGLIEYSNLSVGRGTDHPFSFFGAGIPPAKPSTSTATGGHVDASVSATPTAWFKASDVASYLTARQIPGVTFTSTTELIAEDANHYPFHGQTIEAVRVTLTDPRQADTPELGVEILAALHHLYPTQFHLAPAMGLVCNRAVMEALSRGDDPRAIAAAWATDLKAFQAARAQYLLYP